MTIKVWDSRTSERMEPIPPEVAREIKSLVVDTEDWEVTIKCKRKWFDPEGCVRTLEQIAKDVGEEWGL